MRHVKLMFFCVIAIMALNAGATSQEGDVIEIDGKRMSLFNKPIYYTDSLTLERWENMMPSQQWRSTSNYSGYTAYWEISDGELILNSIRTEVYDPKTDSWPDLEFDTEKLKSAFADYYRDGRIHADWYTGKLRAIHGACLDYVHSGWKSCYEYEDVYELENGKVTELNHYHNYFTEGIPEQEFLEIIMDEFPYDEFADCRGRVNLSILYGWDADDAKVKDVKVKVLRYSDTITEETAQRAAETVENMILNFDRPLKVLNYNGGQLTLTRAWAMPILFPKPEKIKTLRIP